MHHDFLFRVASKVFSLRPGRMFTILHREIFHFTNLCHEIRSRLIPKIPVTSSLPTSSVVTFWRAHCPLRPHYVARTSSFFGSNVWFKSSKVWFNSSKVWFDKPGKELLTNGCHTNDLRDEYTWVLNQKRGGPPKWMVKIMENPIKMDDLGVPVFLETSTWI